jgi:hypothetical protein
MLFHRQSIRNRVSIAGVIAFSLIDPGSELNACFTSLSRNEPSSGTPCGLCCERSLQAYDGVVNVVGEPKFRGFRLSQALANRVVRKGSNFDRVLCGLSPPVSKVRLLACIYTF